MEVRYRETSVRGGTVEEKKEGKGKRCDTDILIMRRESM